MYRCRVTILQAYEQLLQRQSMSRDKGQAALALRMDQVLHDLNTRTSHHGFFGRLFGGKPTLTRGVYIHGPVGRGKSMMMNLLVEAAAGQARRLHFAEWTAQLHELMAQARNNQGDPIAHVVSSFAGGTRLLCVDELEVRDITDAMLLARVMKGLFAKGLVLVTTSNTPPDQLYEGGLNRPLFLPFIQEIHHHCDVVLLDDGEDYRRRHLQEAGVWHQRIGGKQAQEYQSLWADWTAENPPISRQLAVQGRVLPVASSGRAARLPASRLLAEHRGNMDFKILSQAADIVFLDGLTPMIQRDHARRFVMLVDIFYEQGKLLVVDAEVQPKDLFDDQENLGFARTLSRLTEMTSTDWVAQHMDK